MNPGRICVLAFPPTGHACGSDLKSVVKKLQVGGRDARLLVLRHGCLQAAFKSEVSGSLRWIPLDDVLRGCGAVAASGEPRGDSTVPALGSSPPCRDQNQPEVMKEGSLPLDGRASPSFRNCEDGVDGERVGASSGSLGQGRGPEETAREARAPTAAHEAYSGHKIKGECRPDFSKLCPFLPHILPLLACSR